MEKRISLLTLILSCPFVLLAGVDDHGDTMGTATPVAHGKHDGNFETGADIDWFKFTVTQTGRVFAAGLGLPSTQIRVELFDSAGSSLSNPFVHEVSEALDPGEYFLKATPDGAPAASSYTLLLQLQESAPVLPSGETAGILTLANEQIFYRVDKSEEGIIRILSENTAMEMRGTAFDAEGANIGNLFGGENTDDFDYGPRREDAGTILLSVFAGNAGAATGDFTLKVLLPVDHEKVTKNGTMSGEISEPRDVRVYKFTIRNSGRLTVETKGTTDTKGIRFGLPNGSEKSDGGEGDNFGYQIQYSPGGGGQYPFDFYILVRGEDETVTGAFDLCVELPDNRPPAFKVIKPRPKSIIKKRTVTFVGKVTDATEVDRFLVLWKGKYRKARIIGKKWKIRLRTKFLPQSRRKYSVRLWAWDTQNNSRAARVTYGKP